MRWLERVGRDLQFGFRNLSRSPGFAALAVLSLAIGIMATTAIYSVVRAVVLDPFPYKDVDRLASVRVFDIARPRSRSGYTIDQFLEFSERNTVFQGVIASTISDVLWTGEGDPQRLRGNHGTFNTFDVMGVAPLIGRTPTADDARPGAEPVAVLGYRFWQRQFGGDANVIGRRMRLNDTMRTVIGVMPKRFMWRGADVYLPTHFERGRSVEGVRMVHLLGRLKDGVTYPQAHAGLTPTIAALKQKEPAEFPDQWRVEAISFEETFPSSIRRDIWVLFGAVALLLLISCANVSNLLLSRLTSRQREMAVRAALGASRGRLVSQLLTESLLLALVAGVVGTALAYAGLPAILALVPPNTIPDESEIAIEWSVLLFTIALTALTSVICGLAPAWQGSRRDLALSMREVGRGISGSARHAILRKALVVVEVALAVMLLAGSSLLVRTFAAMQQVDFGVDPERVLTMRVPLPPRMYPDAPKRIAFFQDLLERVRAVPGVEAVGLNSGLHPLGNLWMAADVDGAPSPPNAPPVQVHQINDGYPIVFGLQLVRGRLLTAQDVAAAQPVAVVNERLVRERFDGRDPLGHAVRLPRLAQPPFSAKLSEFQIVGVVRDARNNGLVDPLMPEVFVPYTVSGFPDQLFVRAAGDASALTRSVVGQVYGVDRNQPVTNVRTLDHVLAENQFARPRFNLTLLSVFAAAGLLLALIGVYGVMASAVAQERHEIGVRLALGARAGGIARMVLARGSRLLIIGTLVGFAGTFVIGRLLARQVWNVPPFDPLAFAAVAALLFAAGLQACFWPARRAARTDPMAALRSE